MSNKIDKTLILNAIKKEYNCLSNTKLAKKLGVPAQTISTWYARNTFNIELLYSKCEGIDANWLLTGKGNMLKETKVIPINKQTDGNLENIIVEKILKNLNLESLEDLYQLNNVQMDILERLDKLEKKIQEIKLTS